MSRDSLRSALIGFAMLTLAGCATTAPVLRPQTEQEAAVNAIESWQLDGRIALKRGSEGFSAGIDWQQRPGDFRVELTGPLGETRARLTGSPVQVVLELPDHAPLASTDVESLLRDHFGWQLPVDRLRWWVRGLAGPGTVIESRDAEGRIKRLVDDGWQVDYLDWQAVDGLWLPKRLEARHAELTVKLAFYGWQF